MAGASAWSQKKGRLRSALLTALAFGLVGPAIGTLLYASWAFVQSESSTPIGTSILAGVWLLPFCYLLGLVPAAASGLVTGFLGRDLRPAPFIALATAVGAAGMGSLGFFDGPEHKLTEGVVNLAILGGLAGGLSGAFCRALASRSRIGR